jgi:hypothetical protein
MSDKKPRADATARITISLDVKLSGVWGPDCTVEQAYKQAGDSARQVVQRLHSVLAQQEQVRHIHNLAVEHTIALEMGPGK